MDHMAMTQEEYYLLREGTWLCSYDKLGAHLTRENGREGCRFAVWAPHAAGVRVVGTFNSWNSKANAMLPGRSGGVWHLFIPGVCAGDLYKFAIQTSQGEVLYKADPYAFSAQKPPETASVVSDLSGFRWRDSLWLARRKKYGHRGRPLNIYEVHLASWKRHEDGGYYTYEELAEELVPYAVEMGYTHLELLPIMEHPFDGSWGYQITGYYAATSRHGSPKELMAFIDCCHRAGLGVILDWVPGHFCRDAHGLGRFDGDMCYEKGDHAQWGTYIFDLGRGEVMTYLLSNALFWLEKFHADGLRVDGVTSMLYRNFGVEEESQKTYNEDGTEENREAIAFLQALNQTVGRQFPGVMMIAEESTAWPLVTYPPEDGGLGFHYKWDMGWMNDTLNYMRTDFPYRPGNHHLLTFSMMYAFQENFILPLSHDEVVHGKCSLIQRMPGDYWRQFAGMRLLALYQICHPGGKLSFMGGEIAQFIEWRYYEGLEWFLTGYESHKKQQSYIKALNVFYRDQKALWQDSVSWDGFQWLDADDSSQSILIFLRRGKRPADDLVVVLNFRPDSYESFRIGVPRKGTYDEVFNSDSPRFGGSGKENPAPLPSSPQPQHGQPQSIEIRVPPIGGVVLRRKPESRKNKQKSQES